MVRTGAVQATPRVTARRVIVEGVLLTGSLLWKGMGGSVSPRYDAAVGIAPLSAGVLALVEPTAPRDRGVFLSGGEAYTWPRPVQPVM